MKSKITVSGRAFNRLIVSGEVTTPLKGLSVKKMPVSTLDDIVTHFRGNQAAAARFLGIDRGCLMKCVKDRRPNFVIAFDAGNGEVIYKLLK